MEQQEQLHNNDNALRRALYMYVTFALDIGNYNHKFVISPWLVFQTTNWPQWFSLLFIISSSLEIKFSCIWKMYLLLKFNSQSEEHMILIYLA